MSMARALITGGGGQLASDLEALLQGGGQVYAPARAELDITDDAAVDSVFAEFRPTIVFNCAAFHNVEVCEREEDQAFAVNARARQAPGRPLRGGGRPARPPEHQLRV